MPAPILTVLMTVRNGEPYLHKAAESILTQTYRDYRFLILDNASTDDSRELIRSFNDPRIDLVELPEDIGQTAALNRGLQMVETPWVARMDADDISLPLRFELQMAYLQRHPDVVLLGSALHMIDRRGRILRAPYAGVTDVDLRWLHLVGRGGFGHSAAVFATDAAVSAGGYPSQYRYSQDYALWGLLLRRGRVANLPQRLVHIRLHEANATDVGSAEQEIRSILQEHLRTLFADQADRTLHDLARALRSDFTLVPSSTVVECLSAVPGRFAARYRQRPCPTLLRQYARHWLLAARVASLRSRRAAVAWIGLGLRVYPGLLADRALWHTLSSTALAPLRRRRSGGGWSLDRPHQL